MSGAIPLLPQYAFMTWCSVKKAQGLLYPTCTYKPGSLKYGATMCSDRPSPTMGQRHWNEVMVKFSLCLVKYQAMKTYGKWRYSFTYSSPRHKLEVSGQFHASAALTPGKELPVHVGREAGWVGWSAWAWWRTERNLCSCRESNNGRPACSLVTILTELSQLLTDIWSNPSFMDVCQP
jgi:hypothetical protein